MNYIFTTVLGLLFSISSILNIPYQTIDEAFSKGDASKIMSLGAAKTLISIQGKEGIYSKSQATQILGNFFKANPPKSFSFSFKGKGGKASTFAVGEYVSNRKFRVSLKFKNINNTYRIESITITAQK